MIWRHQKSGWQTVSLHGAHAGSVAFVCCNGPSFADVDVSCLCGAGRVVIGLNSTYPKLRPDYWLGMDKFENYDQALLRESFPKILRGNFKDAQWENRPFHGFSNMLFADVHEKAQFTNWTEKATFHWPGNTFFIALQFAFWIGCRTIYLLGVDMDNSRQDYGDGTYLTPDQRAYNAKLYSQELTRLSQVVRETEEFGVQWASGSPTSKINTLMPFVPPYQFIRAIESKIPHGRQQLHVEPTMSKTASPIGSAPSTD